MTKLETLLNIIITPIVFVLGVIISVFACLGVVLYVPIKFVLLLWGKVENDL